MCLTIAIADIGPADVVLDTEEHFIVYHPRVTAAQRPALARRALAEAGVTQPRHAVRCLCGNDLYWLPVEQRIPRQQIGQAAALAVMAMAGLTTHLQKLLG